MENINSYKHILCLLIEADKTLGCRINDYNHGDKRRIALIEVSNAINDLYAKIGEVVATDFISEALDEF